MPVFSFVESKGIKRTSRDHSNEVKRQNIGVEQVDDTISHNFIARDMARQTGISD